MYICLLCRNQDLWPITSYSHTESLRFFREKGHALFRIKSQNVIDSYVPESVTSET